MGGSRRRYSPEFKAEAVREVLDRPRPVSQVAAEIGVDQGASFDEVDALADVAGLTAVPMKNATGGLGIRYFDPDDKRVQIMYELGEVNGPTTTLLQQVHQGPYIKVQVGKDEYRVPGEYNPFPDSGDQEPGPEIMSGFFDESGGGLSSEPGGGLDAAP